MFGDTVIAGAPFETVIPGLDRHGAAYAIRWDHGTRALGTPQLLLNSPPGPNQRFGERVAMQGNLALVGSPFFSLPVAVFERRGEEDWGPDADSNGGDDNIGFPNSFRFRDYVIEAFNKDKRCLPLAETWT